MMKWTTEFPGKHGLYVWRHGKGWPPEFVYVCRYIDNISSPNDKQFIVIWPIQSNNSTPDSFVHKRGGQWIGPLEEPDEEEE